MQELSTVALAKAERLANEELAALNWNVQDLAGRPKSHPEKVRIAARLRRETTMTLEWIANRLHMGAPTHLASVLQRHELGSQASGKTLF